jgi:hydrogenase expression/formation protein HypE
MTSLPLPAGKIPGQLLHNLLERHPIEDERVLIGPGPGRDSAAVQFGDSALVIKSDPITFPTESATYSLVHVNANDLACQGAIPRWLLVTSLFPAGRTFSTDIEAMFTSLHRAADAINVTIVGGHTEITDGVTRPILMGTMLGEVAIDRLIRPTDAKPGDRLLMTMSAGIEGTAILAADDRSGQLDPAVRALALNYVNNPGISVLTAACALQDAGVVSALHDPTEGGIATAVREMAFAAHAGAVISRDAIPVSDVTAQLTSTFRIDPLGLLSSGALLASVPKERTDRAEQALTEVSIPFAWIGKLTSIESGFRLREGSREGPLPEFAVDELARVLSEGA